MSSYELLVSPSANRVYAGSAPALTVAELAVLGETVLAGRLGAARVEEIAGVGYVAFEGALSDDALAHVPNVSPGFAMFAGTPDELFRPVPLSRLDCPDDELLS